MTCGEQSLGGWSYQAVEENWEQTDLGRYHTYAIQGRDGARRVVAQVHDVTTDSNFAQWIAELLTRGQLSPIHLKDAIEDLLP